VTVTQTGTMAKLFDQGEFGRSGSVVEMMGEPQTTLGLSALFYGGGALFKSDRAKRTAIAGTEATLLSGVLVLGAKWAVGRDRPYDKNDVDEFRPFRGTKTRNTSFPSGHSITAFSMAAVAADQYPSLAVGVLSYGAASLVGVSRVYQDRHWASDVVAGAILGIFVGRRVSRWTTEHEGQWLFATDGRSLSLARRF
jgi:membrane-associated phospholipid phosphatase